MKKTKEIALIQAQCADLRELQVALSQMVRPGVMLAQVFPDQALMRVRVFDHSIYLKLAKVLPPVEDQ